MKKEKQGSFEGGLKVDLKKVSGIQFDPEDREISARVADEIDYIRALVSHLWDNHSRIQKAIEKGEYSFLQDAGFGTDQIYGWIENRLTALSEHIQIIVKQRLR